MSTALQLYVCSTIPAALSDFRHPCPLTSHGFVHALSVGWYTTRAASPITGAVRLWHLLRCTNEGGRTAEAYYCSGTSVRIICPVRSRTCEISSCLCFSTSAKMLPLEAHPEHAITRKILCVADSSCLEFWWFDQGFIEGLLIRLCHRSDTDGPERQYLSTATRMALYFWSLLIQLPLSLPSNV